MFLILLRKYWIYVVAAVAIVGLLIMINLFTNYKPFGWLTGTSASISNTSISVEQINELGELVTAEYYGEVVKSLQGTFEEQRNLSIDSIYLNVQKQLREIKALKPHRKNTWLWNQFKATEMHDSQGYHLLQAIAKDYSDKELVAYIAETELADFTSQFTARIAEVNQLKSPTSRNSRRNRLPDLAYLARGWVKAGIDLMEIDSMSPPGDTINIFGALPKIFNVDINPWYIINEEVSVPGFEIIREENYKSLTFELITMVKKACKDQLERDALDRQMLDQALTNAEVSLGSFFSLFDEDGNTPVVNIVVPKYYITEITLLADKRIDESEMAQVKEITDTDWNTLDSEHFETLEEQQKAVRAFMTSLAQGTYNYENAPGWNEFVIDFYMN